MHVIAAKAVAFYEAMQPEFVAYQQAVLHNARLLASELQEAGLRVVSGGTDTHLVLVDLTRTGITGKRAEKALDEVGITTNKNPIPFDKRPPTVTSGIRLGTPAITTRGFRVEDVRRIAAFVVKVLSNIGDRSVYQEVRQEVDEMCRLFPVPGINS